MTFSVPDATSQCLLSLNLDSIFSVVTSAANSQRTLKYYMCMIYLDFI